MNHARLMKAPSSMYIRPRPGTGLVGELWELPCWAAARTHDCKSQGCRQTRLGKAVAPIGMYVGWVLQWTKLDWVPASTGVHKSQNACGTGYETPNRSHKSQVQGGPG